MRVIEPITITEANLVASNITDSLPNAVSGISYTAWDGTTAFTLGQEVMHAFPEDFLATGDTHVGLFTSLINNNVNYEPFSNYFRNGRVPGRFMWTPDYSVDNFEPGEVAPIYRSNQNYGIGAKVGFISGGTGAFYTSLVPNNTGHTPSSSPTFWRQSAADSYATWNNVTTFGAGDRIAVLLGTMGQVFRSLQAGNLNHNPSSSPTWWAYEGVAYKTYNSSTSYAKGDVVNDPTTRHNYESLVPVNPGDPANLGNVLTDESKWLDLGSSNRWAMVDASNASQTVAPDEIDITIAPGGMADGLALFNLEAREVQIIATESGVGVYNETFDLNDPSFITSWRHYFFDPITLKGELALLDLPFSVDSEVRAIIRNPGSLAKCGALFLGRVTTLGATLSGAEVGIIDASTKDRDTFGNVNLVERGFVDTNSLKVACDPKQVKAIKSYLAGRRAKPTVYIGHIDKPETWVPGFYRDMTFAIENPAFTYLSINIEGLV